MASRIVYNPEETIMSIDISHKRALALLGKKWKAASEVEVDCFRAAAAMGADIKELLDSATIFAEQLADMTDIEAGEAVLLHFGGKAPEDLSHPASSEVDRRPAGAVVH